MLKNILEKARETLSGKCVRNTDETKMDKYMSFNVSELIETETAKNPKGPTASSPIYIGVKAIRAVPMNRADYNIFRGWDLPKDEDGKDEGYLVEYLDDGKPNVDSVSGYVSWSPKEVFDKHYTPIVL